MRFLFTIYDSRFTKLVTSEKQDKLNLSLFTLHLSLFELARLRTYPQHTRAWLPLLRSRPGGVHRRSVVRSPKS